jgi:prolyl-tRNA editing enzyme YbaK/EbsC (Cys-tRNA(Pro) deacylase)
MSAIPAVVQKILEDWRIPYSAADDKELFEIMQSNPPASYSSKVAYNVFLKDELGQVQVLVPGDRMLDLTQLSHAFGRQFTALSAVELDLLKARYKIDQFPAIPQITEMETMIDQALLREQELFVYSGEEGKNWLKIPMSEFVR